MPRRPRGTIADMPSPWAEPGRTSILDVAIDVLGEQELARRLGLLLKGRSSPKLIFTINPEILMHAHRDPTYRSLLNRAALSVADGVGLQWAAAYLADRLPRGLFGSLFTFLFSRDRRRTILPERLTGVRTLEHLLRGATSRGLNVFLLHRVDGRSSLASISEVVRERYPALRFGGANVPASSKTLPPETRAKVSAFAPHVLLADLGAPNQERLLVDAIESSPSVRIAMNVGGSFDFLTGASRRAPLAWQRAGFEWLWRVLREPRRFNRILTATWRFVRVVRDWKYQSLKRSAV